MITSRKRAADTMRFPRRFIPLFCAAFFVSSFARAQTPAGALPEEWNAPIRQLAAKIADSAKPAKEIALSVENQSSLSESQAAAVGVALESQLSQLRIQVQTAQAAAPATAAPGGDSAGVKLILSESSDGYVWIAQVARADITQAQVAIVSAPKLAPQRASAAPPILQRRIVLQQAEPVLDFMARPLGTINSWNVLESRGSSAFIDVSDAVPRAPQPLASAPQSRDPRGRLTISANGAPSILVGAASCAQNPGDPSLFCGAHPAPQWPIGGGWHATYEDARNYFQPGLLSPGGVAWMLPAFFSAATNASAPEGLRVILAELDGKARLYTGSATPPEATFSGWGDEIATIPVDCGAGWHVLVTGPGDWTKPDYIQMYRIEGAQAIPEGERLSLSGPVLSMWTAPGEKSVRVVSRNLETSLYEASLLSASCGG